jgi:hypothetical protein
MSIGLSLHIGVNRPGLPSALNPWQSLLNAENDARRLQTLAASIGFQTKVLVGLQATAESILAEITKTASRINSGDIFFLSYSGHGAQIPDRNGDEDDGKDEVWITYDRMLIDDELYLQWSQFRPDVRIVVFSDSCHSGTITSLPAEPLLLPIERPTASASLATLVYNANDHFYDDIAGSGNSAALECTVLSISASSDDKSTDDGYFTSKVLEVWANGCRGSYRQFYDCLNTAMSAGGEHPFYRVIGKPNLSFEEQSPLKI